MVCHFTPLAGNVTGKARSAGSDLRYAAVPNGRYRVCNGNGAAVERPDGGR